MSENPNQPGKPWTLEFVAERLSASKPASPRVSEPSSTLGRLHQVAAVLANYDASELQAFAASQKTDDRIEDVIRNSTVVYADGKPRLMLRRDVRRAALESLGDAESIRRTLREIPQRPRNALQRMLDGYVVGRPKLLDVQNLDELAATQQVTDWFGGLLEALPDTEDLEKRIEREALLKPFRDLAGTGFAGRAADLAILRTHVGFLESESTGETLARGYQYIRGYRPLMIHAPGGMGKSTLVARFILDHLEPRGLLKALPFVYLDFDRPVLLPERFSTLLDEAARQLAVTFPDRAPSGATRRGWAASRELEDDQEAMIQEFAALLASFEFGDTPILFVLDTFEEVQYRGPDIADAVLARFARLQRVVPGMRIVIAGRAAAASSTVALDSRPLGPLATADAAIFLTDRGIDDPRIARRVADQVGGSPLSLRLALELIEKERDALGASGIKDLETRNALFFRVKDSQIQGQLYRRILNHVSNPDVRKLAHPGLVLRRVTPEIILDVLAGPCGVAVPNLDRAKELFEELQREVSLVGVDADGSLRHLPELRAIMLDLLRQDRPMQVREIQERAVEYYRSQTSLVARAELVYHLLMLRRDRSELDAAWTRGVEQYLRVAIDEIPAAARPYLASRLGVDIGATDLELPDREIRTAKRVRDLLAVHRASEAAALLAEFDERSPGSVLHLPEAETHILTGNWQAAFETAARGLADAALFEEPMSVLKLQVVKAWAERHGTPAAGPPSRQELEALFARFPGQALCLRYAVHRFAVARDEWTRNEMRTAMASFFNGLTPGVREGYVTLCWEVAGIVGVSHPDVLFTILEGTGLVPLTPLESGAALIDAVSSWDRERDGRILGNRQLSDVELGHVLLSARSMSEAPPAVVAALTAVYAEAADDWRTDQHLYEELEEGGRLRYNA